MTGSSPSPSRRATCGPCRASSRRRSNPMPRSGGSPRTQPRPTPTRRSCRSTSHSPRVPRPESGERALTSPLRSRPRRCGRDLGGTADPSRPGRHHYCGRPIDRLNRMAYSTINPATGEQLLTVDTLSDAELDQGLETAHTAYTHWRRRPVHERAEILKSAAAELRANSVEYARYITLEMGKLIGQSEAEVGLAAAILDYYADRAEKLLAPTELPESPGAVVVTEPIGVIFGIEPWNFPYYQVARVAGPQLIAGNAVVIKHAENVPQCALAF